MSTRKFYFKVRMIVLAAILILFTVAYLVTKEKKITIQGNNIRKVQLYKNYPYNRYYVISNGKKYRVNKIAYKNIK